MDIDLHIQELILDGFAPADRDGMAAAVEAELARLLVEQGVPPALAQRGEIAGLDAGAFKVAPGERAEAVGAQVAQAMYRGLDR